MDILDFYDDRHPISETQVLAALDRRRGGRTGVLSPADLFDFDQDHYGGPAAVEALADRAHIAAGARALDLCSGLGGPARVLASRRGCRVVALELSADRAGASARLTRRVGLRGIVATVRGDAQRLPFADGSFDACISQEALLHIPDKGAVLAGCHRILRAGGRLAFTDWIAHPRLDDRERDRLHDWMAATTLQTLEGYRRLVGRAGFAWCEAEDLTADWRTILRERLAVYRGREGDVARRLGHARYREYDQLSGFLLDLVERGRLGGGRFWAAR